MGTGSMKHFIAHRGNIDGPNKLLENTPEYIDQAISRGFDAEIDVWCVKGKLYLGHDYPQHPIISEFLLERSNKLWCHAKNLEAMIYLKKNNLHFFSHDKDEYILTSKSYIWAYIGKPINSEVICVMPELGKYTQDDISNCRGICSDYIFNYSNL